ncbi:MAG: NAD-dependent malic enzyme [Telmatospirillum sp.]|nr:NAD-dependent malic enzyme [Telmatospirillum sp.]
MPNRPKIPNPQDTEPWDVSIANRQLLENSLLNKGTAFTEEERDEFGLHGLLPPHIGTLDEQVARRLEAFRRLPGDLDRYILLRDLQDTNEVLFYTLLARNLEEMLPVVYTPTVGLGCQRFSSVFRRHRGLFLSPSHASHIPGILAQPEFDGIEAIVVTDGERILGLGDQGAGGMGIPIGKLALYTACGGLYPATTLPVVLDVGTDNEDRLNDPLYVGWRHRRIRGADYDAFIESFITAVEKRWPHVLLQWEDFAKANAGRLLERYRDRLCTFNDDIQGTASVATGTLLAAINVTGIPLAEQRIVILGAGSAGTGIATLMMESMVEAGISRAEARTRFHLVDRDGLLLEGMPGLMPAQEPFARPLAEVAGWRISAASGIGLADVVRNVAPTVLIGVSGQAGAFTREVVTTMAAATPRPVIFPLSNPTSCAEAVPQDLLDWSQGRAVIGTGSPFPPASWQGQVVPVAQTNNSYIFPGVGLGAIAVKARRVTDSMFIAAARALAEMSPARLDPGAPLLPPVGRLRDVAFPIALAVARKARAEGLTEDLSDEEIAALIRGRMWEPHYHAYRRVPAGGPVGRS